MTMIIPDPFEFQLSSMTTPLSGKKVLLVAGIALASGFVYYTKRFMLENEREVGELIRLSQKEVRTGI